MAGLCNEGAYLRIERGTRFRGLRVQVRRDDGGGRPDRGRGLQDEPAAREVEVVPETQAAVCCGVRRSRSNGKPNVARFESNARATGAARARARRWASANFTGSYELYRPIAMRPRGIAASDDPGGILN